MTLDVVIPTLDRPEALAPLVGSLDRQRRNGDTIIIVPQGTLPLPSLPAYVRHIDLPHPNLPAARNRALAESQADALLFLDDDVLPFDGLLDAHRACYERSEICGVAGYIDDPLFDRTRLQPSFLDLTNGDCVQNFSLPASGKTVSAMGANMSFRRSALASINGFDRHFTNNALWEEIDCCLRLLATGGTLWYCAGAKVKHLRLSRGGCRTAGRYRYRYHQFANTAYFACRFAPRAHYKTWIDFWKYRLEFLSRTERSLKNARYRHDLLAVAAGVSGALAGIGRYGLTRLTRDHGRYGRIDRKTLHAALAALGSTAGTAA